MVTLRQLGKGRVLYVALPFFKAYLDYQNFYQARLFLELLDRLLPDPLVRITTRAQVEVSALRQGEDLIVHLVNHSGRGTAGGILVSDDGIHSGDLRYSRRDPGSAGHEASAGGSGAIACRCPTRGGIPARAGAPAAGDGELARAGIFWRALKLRTRDEDQT